MTKIAILIPILAACAAEPSTSSAEQQMCKTDPLTGQCPTRASLAAEAWIDDNFPDAAYDSLACFTGTDSAGHSNIQCTATIEWGGAEYSIGCSWWSTGSLDCSADD